MRLFCILPALLGLTLFSGCSSGPRTCAERDWFELGRQDGARGLPRDEAHSLPKVCAARLSEADILLYRNGWNLGVAQFCSEENGFLWGKENKKANANVCPPAVREDFVRNYKTGLRHFQLSQEIFDIDQQINQLNRELERTPLPNQSAALRSRLKDLSQKKQAFLSELEQMNRTRF